MHKHLALALLLAALAANAQACDEHPWYRLPPDTVEAEHLAPTLKEALPEAREQAIRLLKQRAFVPLSPDEAAKLTGEPAVNWVVHKTFLLRGLRYANEKSLYSVYFSYDGSVVVRYLVLGGSADGKPYAAPVVAVMPETPGEVYVTCGAPK
ncbi:MAG TPA: hypothetical protein VIU46_03410 [Gallionellaceae bacterium]